MVKPRQEFIGPITKLAAIDLNGVWTSDGTGIVDGYGAIINNCTLVLNAKLTHPATGAHTGSFWVNDGYSPTLPFFTDSAGNDIQLGTGGSGLPSPVINTILWSNGSAAYWSANPIIGGAGSTPTILFGSQATNPLIGQEDMLVSGIGKDLTLSAQSNTSSSSTGGNLRLKSGIGSANNGSVYISPGNGSVIVQSSNFTFDDGYLSPLISQKATLGTVNVLRIIAQSSLTASATGGALELSSGTGGSGGVSGTVSIQNGAGNNNTQFSYDSAGYKVRHQGRIELADETTFNQNWSADSDIIQCADDRIISTSKSGYGTYTIVPRTYEQITYRIPRLDKQFGTFQLTGTTEIKSLNFNTGIHGFPMPTSTILTGRFMIGWMGNGSYSAGGALQFLFTITSDSSGNIKWFNSSLSDNQGIPGGSVSVSSGTPSPTHGDSMWTIPSGSNAPLIQIVIPSAPTTNFTFTVQAVNNPFPTDYARFFWEMEYGWGTNT